MEPELRIIKFEVTRCEAGERTMLVPCVVSDRKTIKGKERLHVEPLGGMANGLWVDAAQDVSDTWTALPTFPSAQCSTCKGAGWMPKPKGKRKRERL